MKLLAYLACTLYAYSLASAETYLHAGPMLGHITSNEANLWIWSTSPTIPSVVLSKQAEMTEPQTKTGDALSAANHLMTKIKLEGLEPDQRYHYAIELDGKRVTQRPYPSFKTAPSATDPHRQRIAFTSCLGSVGQQPAAGWAQMLAYGRADLVLLLGDNHYANTTERQGQSRSYFSHRINPSFRALGARLPIYGIWDDHDYGPNDSDGTAKGKEESLDTFKSFWPNPAFGEKDNPGTYYKFSRAGVDFFMLDVRYHRSPDKQIDDGSKTVLGSRQLAWLKTGLAASEAKVKIIASGSEWQRNSHADSWSSFPRERDEIFEFIDKEAISGVLLLSGDRHFTGGYQIGGKLIEITSGPLGSKNYPTKNLPEMFLNQGEGKLFSILDINLTAAEPAITLEVHRAGDGIVKKMQLPWKAILGEEKLDPLPVETTPKKHPFQIPFKD